MKQLPTKWVWMDSSSTVTLTELSQCCAMSEAELDELVDYFALVPLVTTLEERTFSAQWVSPLCAPERPRKAVPIR